MTAEPTPVNLRAGDDRLYIEWSDGLTHEYSWSILRKNCPCATCRDKHNAPQPAQSPMELPVLTLQEAVPLRVVGMKPVGNYAYGISFSDGHSTGIYSLELLRALGTPATN